MTEEAKELKIDPVTVEGLEEVFLASEEAAVASEPSEEEVEFGSEDSEVSESSIREIITTEEASQRLGISARAVINRLKAGTLEGRKVRGKYRKEWRVFWEEVPKASEESPEIAMERSEDSEEPSEEGSEVFGTGKAPQEAGGSAAISGLLEQNQRLMDQMHALTYRNGYLEAKLEAKEEEIKLLTDRQRDGGWWSRFCSWFLGSGA